MKWIILTLIFGLAIGVFELVDKRIKREKLKWTNWLIIGLSAFVVLFSVLETIRINKIQKYSNYTGVLDGQVESEIKYPSLAVGGTIFKFSGISRNVIYNEDEPIQLWIENNQLLLTLNLRDSLGNIVARIDRNEWDINENEIFDRNFDNHGLEIVDKKGDIILQLDYNREVVQFAGVLHTKDGRAIAYYPKDSGGAINKDYNPEIDTTDEVINLIPLFNYPSSLHMGERNLNR